jgi:hypothetical protein
MAGGTVRAENVRTLLYRSRVSAVHSRATDPGVFKAMASATRTVAAKPVTAIFKKRERAEMPEETTMQEAYLFPSQRGADSKLASEVSLGKRKRSDVEEDEQRETRASA